MKEKFVQINLRIHESTMEKLKELAWLSGRSNKEGAGHCRIAKEILESEVVKRLDERLNCFRLNGFKGI